MEFQEMSIDEKREYILSEMNKREVIVEFTKVSGEHRVMPCTLVEAALPPPKVHVSNTDNPVDFPVTKERKVSPDVIRTFCTDKQEWRSFRIDSVISIK